MKTANPFVTVRARCGAPNCTSERREANHWFMLKLSTSKHGVRLVIMPFSDALLNDPNVVPVEGGECLHKLVDRFTTSGKII